MVLMVLMAEVTQEMLQCHFPESRTSIAFFLKLLSSLKVTVNQVISFQKRLLTRKL